MGIYKYKFNCGCFSVYSSKMDKDKLKCPKHKKPVKDEIEIE